MSVVKNDLYDYGLKIYQDTEKFKFSLDSLLLAEFVEVKKSDKKLLDLCSGNAPLPLIIASKYEIEITGIEIQKAIYDLALKSIEANKLTKQIKMLNMNVLDSKNYFPGNNFDVITCNPPFFKVDKTSLINKEQGVALARHELAITLEGIFQIVSYHLKDNGKFYMVHRPERLQEIMNYASKHHLALKEIKFISSKEGNCAIMMLLKLVKNGQIGTKVSSIIINRENKTYQNIFNKRANK